MNIDEAKRFKALEDGPGANKIIELRSVWKQGRTTVSPVPDGMGWYLGIPRLSEEEKRQLKYWATPDSTFELYHGVTFDLNNEQQRVTWEWVKYSPAIAPDEATCQSTPGVEYYVYEEAKELNDSIKMKELRLKAGNLIINDAVSNHALRALLLGVDMEGLSPVAIKEFLLEKAEEDPVAVINVYESRDLNNRLLFLKAVQKGVIKKDPVSGIYSYGNITLGMSEKSAVSWLGNSNNKHIIEALEREVNPGRFVTTGGNDSNEELTKDTTSSTNNQQPDKDETKTAKKGAKGKAEQGK